MIFKNSVGVSLSEKRLSAVYVRQSFDGPMVQAQESWSIDISESRLEFIAARINSFIAEQPEPPSEVYLGIPADKFIIKTVSFPSAVKENLREALRYEMERIVPVNPDELVYDFMVVSESGGFLKTEVFIFKKSDFENYFELAESIRGGLSGILLTSQIVHHFIENASGTKKNGNGLLVLRYEDDPKEYSLSIENDFYTGKMGQNNHLPGNLEKLITDSLLSSKKSDYDFYVYRSGECEGVSESIADMTEIEGDFFKDAGITDELCCGAFALASDLEPFKGGILNFLPEHKRRKKDLKPIKIMLFLLVVFVCSLLFLSGAWIYKKKSNISKLDSQVSKLKIEAEAVEKIRVESDQMETSVKDLALIFNGMPATVDVLKAITEIIPPDTWIKQLNIRDGKLELYGVSSASSSLVPLFESSPLFDDVRFLSPITKDKDGKDIFRLGMKYEALKKSSEGGGK